MRTVTSAASNVASGEAPAYLYRDAYLRNAKEQVVATPAFAPGTRVADTHAHLDMLHNPGLALARAAANGVDFVVTVMDPTEEPSYTLENLDAWQAEAGEILSAWGNKAGPPEVCATIGCHPHNASRYDAAVEAVLERVLTSNMQVTALGEVGLDYHYDKSPREMQQQVFRRQIQLAHQHGCKLVLHLREAHEDGLRILQEEGVPQEGLLLHCFNLDYTTLEPFLELGALAAFGGPLTFKKAEEVRDAAARTPLDRLVTETDCPFMAPVPVRGTVCEPACTVFTAELLASLRPEPNALDRIYQNAQNFFAAEREL